MSYELLNILSSHFTLPPKIDELRASLGDKQWRVNSERVNSNPVPIMNFPVKAQLYKHQARAVNMAMIQFEAFNVIADKNFGFGLLFDMGCGKTLTAITIIGCLYQLKRVKRVLVVAPASVCAVWPKDFNTFADYDYRIAVLAGDKKKRLKNLAELESAALTDSLVVAVINYESVWRPEIFKALTEFDADIIVCDESQRIKTHNANQSKALHKLGDKARYKVILTGTPITNNMLDAYSQYRFLDSSVFGTNFYTFKSRYAEMGGYQQHQVIGYKDKDGFIAKLHSVAYRVTKEDALDLPEQTFEKRYVAFSTKDRKLYDEIRRQSVAELENETITAQTVLTKLLRLQQLTGGFTRTDESERVIQVNTSKLDALQDILEDYVLEDCGKLVIFARFTAEIGAIEKLLTKLKIKYVSITGAVPISERGAIVSNFQTNKDTQVFIAQLQCAGLGITLTAAHVAVYFSLNFSYTDYAQSQARTHRIGQRLPCHYIHLLIEDSIDDKCLKALEGKEGIAQSLVDNWKDFFN